MKLKELLENSPALIVGGTLLSGFLAGISTMSFLEARDKALRESISLELQIKNAQLSTDNASLKVSNDQLDQAVRDALVRLVNSEAARNDGALGGPHSQARDAQPAIENLIKTAPQQDVSKFAQSPNPIRSVTEHLGLHF